MEGEEEEQIDEDTFLGVLERSAEDLEKAKTEIRPNEPSASVGYLFNIVFTVNSV